MPNCAQIQAELRAIFGHSAGNIDVSLEIHHDPLQRISARFGEREIGNAFGQYAIVQHYCQCRLTPHLLRLARSVDHHRSQRAADRLSRRRNFVSGSAQHPPKKIEGRRDFSAAGVERDA